VLPKAQDNHDSACIGISARAIKNGTYARLIASKQSDGGAVYNDNGKVMLVSCALTNNTAQALMYVGVARGGAIFNNGGAVSLCQSVITANSVVGGGPNNDTGSGSAAIGTGLGGAIYNTIIAYGGANGNAFGPITDDGFNISSDGSANLFSGSSDNYTDPKLGLLNYYTGPTPCMALLSNSLAIDFGDSSGAPSTDQRGYPRPNGNGVDIGAFEFYYPYQAGITRPDATASGGGIGLDFTLFPASAHRIQASSNLVSWIDLETNGPFASVTNISRTFGTRDFDHRFFRLLLQ
jgi:hypothetical protein